MSSFTSDLVYSRGKHEEITTETTAETVVITATQGTAGMNGISVICTGTGAGVLKVYFIDALGVECTDPVLEVDKDAAGFSAINYGGRLPKFVVKVTPSGSSSMTWLVEVCGVA